MSDDDAFMALVLNNMQGELAPLEIGLHQLASGMTVRDYAAKVSMAERTLLDRVHAAKVASVVDIHDGTRWQQFAAMHIAPEWLWPALKLHARGIDRAEGERFNITRSDTVRWSLDTAAAREALGEAWVTAHSRLTPVTTFRITVRRAALGALREAA
jgi:hypothetical protein